MFAGGFSRLGFGVLGFIGGSGLVVVAAGVAGGSGEAGVFG